jgi:hypothetical protein
MARGCGRAGIRDSGCAQAFGRATSAGCLGSPRLNLVQVSDGLAGSGYPVALRVGRNAGAGRCGGRRLGQSVGGPAGSMCRMRG